MPVPSSITDLSTTAGSNSPAGSETPTEGDNYIRTYGAFIALLRDKLNGTSDTGTVKNATFSGTMAGAASWAALQTFAAGLASTTGTFSGDVSAANIDGDTYTPTGSAVSNAGAPTTSLAHYQRIDSIVYVSGSFSGSSLAGGLSTVGITLPIASAFTSALNCRGVANANSGAVCFAGFITADTTNDRAEVTIQATSALSFVVYYSFSYRIL